MHYRNTSVLSLTLFAGSMPEMSVQLSGSGSQSSTNRGVLSFVPTSRDIGRTFEATVQSSNLSVVTLAFGEFVDSDSQAIRLRDGIAQHDSVDERHSRYYLFVVPPFIQDEVLITLDSLQGDADLYVNPPGRGFYNRARGDGYPVWACARSVGTDSISIDFSDNNYVGTGGAYYISVYGSSLSEYVLRAQLSNTIVPLLEDTPTAGSLRRGKYRYYRYFDRLPQENLFIDLMPSYGDADLMVACSVQPTGLDSGRPSRLPGHFNFTSQNYWEDSLMIAAGDPKRCPSNVYFIAVFSFLDSSYSLTAMHENEKKWLVAGSLSRGNLLTHMSALYGLRVGFEAASLTITLQPQSGDCDIYVKLRGIPSTGSYDYKSINYGRATDVVHIPESAMCTQCEVMILVHAVSSSAYQLVASFEDDVIGLNNGVPFRGSVAANFVQYYSYTPSVAAKVVASLTVLSGSEGQVHLSILSSFPNTTSQFTEHSPLDAVVPTVYLATVPARREVHIGVTGTNMSYTVRVHEIPLDSAGAAEEPVVLSLFEGLPQSDAMHYGVTSDWVYYAIPMRLGHETLTIRSTSLVGNIDLFVKRCTGVLSRCTLPTLSNFTVSTQDMDMDVLTIFRSDDVDCFYLVGVLSYSYYAAFQIVYGIEGGLTELQAGISVLDHVLPGEKDFYSFTLARTTGAVRFSLTTTAGDPDMFVSTVCTRPSLTNSTWRSQRFGGDVLTIDPSIDPMACYGCTYYITIAGLLESTYTLQAALLDTQTSVQDGRPLAGSVAAGSWVYYIFQHGYGNTRDLKLSLNSIQGNADMYVTLDGSVPTLSHYSYASTRWFTSDEILIHHNDAKYQSCRSSGPDHLCSVKIGIYGFTSAQYSFTLVSNSSATLLALDRFVPGTVSQHSTAIYQVHPSRQASMAPYKLRVSISVTSGRTSLFASCRMSDVDQTTQGGTNHSAPWSLSPVPIGGGVLDLLSLSFLDAGCLSSNSALYVGVYGDLASTYAISATVTNGSNAGLIQLQPNLQVSGSIEGNLNMMYYYLWLGSKGGSRSFHDFDDLRLLLTTLVGDVDLYVSTSWDGRPVVRNGVVTSYVKRSASMGSEDLTLNHGWLAEVCGTDPPPSDPSNGHLPCYLILAVVDVSQSVGLSQYTLLASPQDSIIALSNGLPQSGHVSARSSNYYVFPLHQVDVDISISLSALSGDPDLFVGLGGIHHPNPRNFSLAHMSLGEDDLTLQYSSIKQYCVPDIRRACMIYLGVFGWSNASYSLTVSTDEGFQSRSLLLDAVPTSGYVAPGAYRYYSYRYSLSSASIASPLSLKFTLTPTDGGDLDLYLKFSIGSDIASLEPGKDQYDLKSVGWSSVTEEIELLHTDPQLNTCISSNSASYCEINLAVYGYTGGHYHLQVASRGVLTLTPNSPQSGHVSQDSFVYYAFFNHDPFAIISLTLTALQGDADIYLSTYTGSNNNRNDILNHLPTRTSYTWRSLSYGSDRLTIDYDSDGYCTDCLYLLGVYGFRNSTYSLLLTLQEAAIVRLVSGRPQQGSLEAGNDMYYSTNIVSSLADVTLTLTSLNTGTADLYVQIYNSSTFNSAGGGDQENGLLPDPENPRTYSYTTAGTEENHIFIPGPHTEESVLVVTVRALSSVRFLIVCTSSNRPVLLLAGQPQIHYVGAGQNELFQFYPDSLEDLHITLTARSGDPDLLVSSQYSNPHCVPGSTPWQVHCSNFTWTSRSAASDQIIISYDSPCSAILPNTFVDPSCDPLMAYRPAAYAPVFITVYGYSAARFTLVVSPVGGTVSLLPGVPQVARTTSAFICSQRNEDTDVCLPASPIVRRVQQASFSFHVAAREVSGGDDVILTILPQCNSTGGNDANNNTIASLRGARESVEDDYNCIPGCPCAPLEVWISSCLSTKCTALHRHPSALPGHHQLNFTVAPDAGTSTVLISRHIAATEAVYCNPRSSEGSNEECNYFVSVTHRGDISQSAVFSIAARTPGDVLLVPCMGQLAGDAILARRLDDAANKGLYYELCLPSPAVGSSTQESLMVELEQCSGSTTLYACADDGRCLGGALPSTQSYAYRADVTQTCIHRWDHNGRDSCQSSYDRRAHLILPTPTSRTNLNGDARNYFLLANGTGRFSLTISRTVGGRDVTPRIVLLGSNDISRSTVSATAVTGNHVTLQWAPSGVLLPNIISPVAADFLTYRIHIFDTSLLSQATEEALLTSSCGLERMSYLLGHTGASVFRIPTSSIKVNIDRSLSYTLKGLKTHTRYTMVLSAQCDSDCLRQVSKVSLMDGGCGSGLDCQTQTYVYSSVFVATSSTPDADEGDSTEGGGDGDAQTAGGSSWMMAIVLLILLLLALVGLGGYWYKMSVHATNEFSARPTFADILGARDESYKPPSAEGDNSPSTSARDWQNILGDLGSRAKVFGQKVGEAVSSGVDAAYRMGARATPMSSAPREASVGFSSVESAAGAENSTSTTGSSWSTSKPLWGGAGKKGYQPVVNPLGNKKGHFTLEDDNDIEVSL
eukprot:scaffold437_cov168-Ochromonas_danica.AAC.74